MFSKTYNSLRSIATFLLYLVAFCCILIVIFGFISGDFIFPAIITSIILFASAYEICLYLNSYADLVENSFKNLENQEKIICLLSKQEAIHSSLSRIEGKIERSSNNTSTKTSNESSVKRRNTVNVTENNDITSTTDTTPISNQENIVKQPTTVKQPNTNNQTKKKDEINPNDWWTCKNCGQDNYKDFDTCINCDTKKS